MNNQVKTRTRTADPTLDALTPTVIVYVDHDDPVPHAHLSTRQGRTCAGFADPRLAKEACWFAHPCPRCFPTAPRPGHLAGCDPQSRCQTPDAGLAWQITG